MVLSVNCKIRKILSQTVIKSFSQRRKAAKKEFLADLPTVRQGRKGAKKEFLAEFRRLSRSPQMEQIKAALFSDYYPAYKALNL